MTTNDHLPYAGTSGWAGSDTSRERQENHDRSGVTGVRATATMTVLATRGSRGITDRELQHALQVGHGVSSGVLTRLHIAGHAVRLTERRDGNEVYVLPEHVNDRETSPYRPTGMAAAELRLRLKGARALLADWPKGEPAPEGFRDMLAHILGVEE